MVGVSLPLKKGVMRLEFNKLFDELWLLLLLMMMLAVLLLRLRGM